jgi:hypothetical protein
LFYPDFKDEFFNGEYRSGFINDHVRIIPQYKPNEKGTCGVMNNKWQIVVELGIYEDLGLYSEKMIPAKKDGKWGYLKIAE